MFHYPDLFREVADALLSHGLFEEALNFYEALQHVPDGRDSSYFTNMATCYEASGLYIKAIECYQSALAHDSTNTGAKLQLAVLCQELDVPYVIPVEPKDVLPKQTPSRQQFRKSKRLTFGGELGEAATSRRSPLAMIAPRPSLRNSKQATAKTQSGQKADEGGLYTLFTRMESLVGQAREGDADSRAMWMADAKQLIEIFQSERAFFPYEKYMRFYGYTKEARKKSLNSKLGLGSREDRMTTGQRDSYSGEFNQK